MTRITRTNRDWTSPAYRSPWQDERATRFEPTTLGKLRALYRVDREPLWHSVLAGVLVAVCVVGMVAL